MLTLTPVKVDLVSWHPALGATLVMYGWFVQRAFHQRSLFLIGDRNHSIYKTMWKENRFWSFFFFFCICIFFLNGFFYNFEVKKYFIGITAIKPFLKCSPCIISRLDRYNSLLTEHTKTPKPCRKSFDWS